MHNFFVAMHKVTKDKEEESLLVKRKNPASAIFLLLATLGVLLACGESTAGASVVSSGGASSSNPGTQHFKVGQQVKLGTTLIISVNSFAKDPGDQFTQPKSGDKFVKVDVSLKNVSTKSQDISSALNFTMQDATGQKYTEAFVTDATPPDGAIPAGGLLRGQLAYEVPTAQHAFTFTFDLDFTGSTTALWDLTN